MTTKELVKSLFSTIRKHYRKTYDRITDKGLAIIIGMDKVTFSQLQTGVRQPNTETLRKILKKAWECNGTETYQNLQIWINSNVPNTYQNTEYKQELQKPILDGHNEPVYRSKMRSL